MKYQVGDEIVVLHTNEEGKVTEIINDKMVMIEVRGVKFPSYMDQIDFPYFKRFTQNKAILQPKKEKKFVEDVRKEKLKPAETQVAEGVWLSLIPKFTLDEFGDEVVELFKLHLVNKTPRGYKFIYEQKVLGDIAFELTNEITGYHDFYLHDIKFGDFNDNPTLFFEFSLITPDKKKAEYFETSLKLKGKQIFQRVEEMKQKNEPTVTFKLFENYPDKTQWINNEIPKENEVAIWSAREGKVPGTHIVKYISDIDQIEISHVAHGREGFALGAVIAAEWIVNKKGIFGMKELLSLEV